MKSFAISPAILSTQYENLEAEHLEAEHLEAKHLEAEHLEAEHYASRVPRAFEKKEEIDQRGDKGAT